MFQDNLHRNPQTLCKFDNSISGDEPQTGGRKISSPYHNYRNETTGALLPMKDGDHDSYVKDGEHDSCACEVSTIQPIDTEANVDDGKSKVVLLDSCKFQDSENCIALENQSRHTVVSSSNLLVLDPVGVSTSKNDHLVKKMDNCLPISSSLEVRATGSFGTVTSLQEKLLSVNPVPHNNVRSSKKQYHCKEVKPFISPKLKSKPVVNPKEIEVDSTTSQVEQKTLPQFGSYLVEDEEGSGGYGTVYRARCKVDGKLVAIKCPHENSPRRHVYNEQRILERFGGMHFIIKYAGSFRSGNADCFILEHVKHDRPEILKQEINMIELQWYGFCLFKSLAFLHKQGVVHRDVKPGNFLFSRKRKKGYLIDFNLALDLQQKFTGESKTNSKNSASFDPVPSPHSKSVAMRNYMKPSGGKNIAIDRRSRFDSQPLVEHNTKETNVNSLKTHQGIIGRGHIIEKQGGDGSGITFTKDTTTTNTLTPAKRQREPVPCRGRKELIDLARAQGSKQCPNSESISNVNSHRKRVSAFPSKPMLYITPMPLRSGGVGVSGAGLKNFLGDGKHKKEAGCVGTKGFRAPEVLLRSSHQGYKMDVWSAGVALLYLTMGRSPFTGDPDENMKDIAKLRGSEDLWELAKLHNCESSFPKVLLEVASLPCMKLEEWWKQNTKRADFLKQIPMSLFDLMDKCLSVNPRVRISAHEALKHPFFASCHQYINKLLQDQSNTTSTT